MLGYIKVLTAPGKFTMLDTVFVGEQAGELIAEYVLAMMQAHAPQRRLAWVERFRAWRRQ